MEIAQTAQLQRTSSLWDLQFSRWAVKATRINSQENVHLWMALTAFQVGPFLCPCSAEKIHIVERVNQGYQLRARNRVTWKPCGVKRARKAADTLGRFGKAHDHAGLWCREGVGGTGTLYAQHKEAAACSLMEKVLLVLEWFVAQKCLCLPIPQTRAPSWIPASSPSKAHRDVSTSETKRGKMEMSTLMNLTRHTAQ